MVNLLSFRHRIFLVTQNFFLDKIFTELLKLVTVSSAYKMTQLALEERCSRAETSHAREERRSMWREVWKLPVKPKLKHFLWKCIHNWLATNSAVRERGVMLDEVCRRCGRDKEIQEHLFFHCEESTLIWKLSPVKWDGFQYLTGSFEDWWRAISTAARDSDTQKGVQFLVYMLWQIWKGKNLWQFQEQRVKIEEVVQRALQEWQDNGEIIWKTAVQRNKNCRTV